MCKIGERIQQLRKSKKLTQTEFGKMFGVTHAHISNIERGKENPSEMFILFIVEKLKVNEIWLRTGEEEMYSIPNFDTITDSGNKTKFELLNQHLVNYMNNIGGEELKIFVNTLSYFQSSLMSQDFKNTESKMVYLKELEKIVKLLDTAFANANGLTVLKNKSVNYKTLLSFSAKTNKEISQIDDSIRTILNRYIDLYLCGEKLTYKLF